MTNKLAENIRAFRKQRSLTQEQLAEVLGVTTGGRYINGRQSFHSRN